MNVRRLVPLAPATLVAVTVTCGDGPTVPQPDQPLLSEETMTFSAAISEPVMSSWSGDGYSSPAGRISEGTVYVAFSAGELPGAHTVRLSNISTGLSDGAVYAFSDGALDPIAIAASVGDTLALEVTRVDGSSMLLTASVPEKRPPRVIRTRPAAGRVDVAVNAAILTVFSEPVYPSTVSPGTVVLLHDGEAVDGTVQISGPHSLSAEFTPSEPLFAESFYTLVVTRGIRDLDGDSLQNAVEVEFRTEPAGPGTEPAGPGTIVVSTATTGADTDPDGYTLSLDGDAEYPIGINSTINVPAEVGPHTVTLSGVAANCTVTSGSSKSVTVADSGTVAVAFDIACVAIGPPLQGQLAFVSERTGNSEIYVVSADGSGLTRLTDDVGADVEPAWSPDGSRIAFSSDRSGPRDIYVMDADGTGVTRRTFSRHPTQEEADQGPPYPTRDAREPAWSPTGSRIMFAECCFNGSSGLVTMSALDDGTGLVRLPDYPGWDAQPAWSPDGDRIAFVSDYAAYDFVFDIYVSSADGTGAAPLTSGFATWPNLRFYTHPAWSPDGQSIAYVYGTIINEGRQWPDIRYRVAVMSADGSGKRDLAWAGDLPWRELQDPGGIAWSPDGTAIAFTFRDCDLLVNISCPNTLSIKYVRVASGAQGTLIDNAHSPSWRR